MPKQTIEIVVPDGDEVACVRHRCDSNGPLVEVRFRPTWKWPSWLKAEYIARDEGDPTYYAFVGRPVMRSDAGVWRGEPKFPLHEDRFDFIPPESPDWRQSLRKNPNL